MPMPRTMHRMGFEITVMACRKVSLVCRGSIAPLIARIPVIRTDRDTSTTPAFFFEEVLPAIYSTTPITATMAKITSVDSSAPRVLSPLSPASVRIQPVAVVPMQAPIMTEIACLSPIIPELTKLTTITEVADDD